MRSAERQAYTAELKRVARNLGIPLRGNLEPAIIRQVLARVEQWIAVHGYPSDLQELLDLVSGRLSIHFVEIEDDSDLEGLLRQIPPEREPVMATLEAELDDQTDGIMIQRRAAQLWEKPFLAVINCRGWHGFRRYFSKWHEASHLLLDGPQLSFVFRKTPILELRRDPGEILVDRVAAALAFYGPIFAPVLDEELRRAGHLSFDLIDKVRERVAPEASRHATILACIRFSSDPVCFIRCSLGYNRQEERLVKSGQLSLLPDAAPLPQAKLRVNDIAPSVAMQELGIRVHKNMRIPESSIVARAFRDPLLRTLSGKEVIDDWQTSSSGAIGHGIFAIEAWRIKDEVWALLRIVDA